MRSQARRQQKQPNGRQQSQPASQPIESQWASQTASAPGVRVDGATKENHFEIRNIAVHSWRIVGWCRNTVIAVQRHEGRRRRAWKGRTHQEHGSRFHHNQLRMNQHKVWTTATSCWWLTPKGRNGTGRGRRHCHTTTTTTMAKFELKNNWQLWKIGRSSVTNS